MTEVVVSGAAGRLGRRIVAQAIADDALELAAALVRDGSPYAGQTVERLTGEANPNGRRFTSDTAAIVEGRVLILVATKAAAMLHAGLAASVGAPVLIATTGFSADEHRVLDGYAEKIPLVMAPNLSMGVAVLTDLVQRASRALFDYHVEVLELHHAKKRDAPSGTAWALARAAAEARGGDIEQQAICARAGDIGARGEDEIGMMSIRGGDIIGEHTVFFAGPTERIELTHRAATRDTFAAGAVTAAKFLAHAEPGRYDMRDVLGLNDPPITPPE